jgi:hypothetical protein
MDENTDRFYLMRSEHFIFLKSIDDVKSSTFTYSIPANYGNQIPIFLQADGDFLSYEILNEKGDNKVIIFRFPPIKKDDKIKIHFEYWVLTKRFNKKNLPEVVHLPFSEKNLPENVKIWLSPTRSVQANNIFIKITSYLMKGFNKNLFSFVKKVMIWNAFRKSFFTTLKRFIVSHPTFNKIFIPDRYTINLEDAFSSFLFGGLCTGQANLGAAMLRSRGIPARVLISSNNFYGENSWLDAQHYLNEFYCPGVGWIQSQSGKLFLTQGDNIILRILYPEDENIAGNGVGGYGGMAPWFWIDSNKIILDKPPKELMSYKLPKSKKIGVPSIRVWKEKKFDIPFDKSDKIMKFTSEVWELFIKNTGVYENNISFSKAINLTKEAIDSLTKLSYDKYLEKMQEAKKMYLAL